MAAFDPVEERRRAAAARSYTTPAVITMLLYFVGWVPGLVANLIYLTAANRDQRMSGVEPEGKGCLIQLLLAFVALPLLLFVLWVARS